MSLCTVTSMALILFPVNNDAVLHFCRFAEQRCAAEIRLGSAFHAVTDWDNKPDALFAADFVYLLNLVLCQVARITIHQIGQCVSRDFFNVFFHFLLSLNVRLVEWFFPALIGLADRRSCFLAASENGGHKGN